MSFRPHGHAEISPSNPKARGVCDRCGRITNHYKLSWQYDWRGTKLQNLRFLVCSDCLDRFQQSGQRTIILPADPIPIQNARPEQYVGDDNPLSAIGANPNPAYWQYGSRIGNMTAAGGVPAAFDGNANKPSFMSAMRITPTADYENYVGINWSGYPAGTFPSSLDYPVRTHSVSSFTITAPNDSTFGSTGYAVQGSDVAIPGSWTTLASGNTAQTVGETITGNALSAIFRFSRVAFWGGTSPVAVAQVSLSVAERSSNSDGL